MTHRSYDASYHYVPPGLDSPQPVQCCACQLGDTSPDSGAERHSSLFTSPQIPRCRPFTSPYKKAIEQFKVKKLVAAQKSFGTFDKFKAAKQAEKAESTSVVSSLVVGATSKLAKTLETI